MNRLGTLAFVAAVLGLLAGLWAGLLRLGLTLPAILPTGAAQHGPLMVSGFLGALIALERAVALGALSSLRWPIAAPVLSGIGALVVLLGISPELGRGLLLLAALTLTAVCVRMARLQPELHTQLLAVAAAAWAVGNLVWLLGGSIHAASTWWIGFLVLTVAAERLELGRVLRHTASVKRLFIAAVIIFGLGTLLTLIWLEGGVRLAGLGLALIGAWLLRYDLARQTIKGRALTRYVAACLLIGHAWLLVGGALWAFLPAAGGGGLYDAVLHSVLLGFVFSMIFGHAPIIVPALTGRLVSLYTPLLYGPLALLHLALVVRLIGDLLPDLATRQWGGVANEVAVLLFAGLAASRLMFNQPKAR